jgi:hypothetical protein
MNKWEENNDADVLMCMKTEDAMPHTPVQASFANYPTDYKLSNVKRRQCLFS